MVVLGVALVFLLLSTSVFVKVLNESIGNILKLASFLQDSHSFVVRFFTFKGCCPFFDTHFAGVIGLGRVRRVIPAGRRRKQSSLVVQSPGFLLAEVPFAATGDTLSVKITTSDHGIHP